MFINNFEDLDKEAANAVHFEIALQAIAKANNRSIKEVATLLNRAMDSFQNTHPFSCLEFKLYHYKFSTGFHSDSQITQMSRFFCLRFQMILISMRIQTLKIKGCIFS